MELYTKNKKSVIISIIAVFTFLGLILYTNVLDNSPYKKSTKKFKSVSMNQVTNLMEEGDDFILYIGRESCPACRDFVNKLSELAEKDNLDILYLDSTDTENRKDIKTFRDEYDIIYVPSLLILKDGKLHTPDIPESSDKLERIFISYGFVGD